MGERRTLFDDLDESLDADRTVPFAFDNVAYEIDLSEENIKNMEAALAPFIGAGRRVGRVPTGRVGARKVPSSELDAVRHWAGKHGFRVSPKGRIPQDAQDAYDEAHKPVVKVTPKTPAKAQAAPKGQPTDPAFSAIG